jgi:PAS domain S-box-containing protein
MGETRVAVESVGPMKITEASVARAVIRADGAVWNANESLCTLVRLGESALRDLGWRALIHSADRCYVAAHLVEVLAGGAHVREFEVRLVPPDGEEIPARMRVELMRDGDGRRRWFLVEAWATT